MKKYIKYIALFGFIGFFGGLISALIQEDNLPTELREEIMLELGSMTAFFTMVGIQVMVLSVLLSTIGFFVVEKMNMTVLSFNKKKLLLPIIFGIVSALLIVLGDRFVFASILPDATQYTFDYIYFLGGLLYGGIVEEVIMRLFLLTMLLFIFDKLKLSKVRSEYIAIIITSLLFGLLHLPAMALITPLTGMIVVRTVLLNAVPAFLFGYLYVKEGLWYSMIAHMTTHIVMQLVLMPIFF